MSEWCTPYSAFQFFRDILINALEMKIEEYIPQSKPTIIAREKSLMLPVVKTNKETTANNVVIVVRTERVNVSLKDLFKISLKVLASGIILRL